MHSLFRTCLFMVALMGLGLGQVGCNQVNLNNKAETQGYSEDNGYMTVPFVKKVTLSAQDVHIDGQARPNSRVRLSSDEGQTMGLSTNDQGLFSVNLLRNRGGQIYELSVEREGAFVSADGFIFVPPLGQGSVALLRSGTPSLPLTQSALIGLVDYDPSGIVSVSGKTKPLARIEISINGTPRGEARANPSGVYSHVMRFAELPQGVLNLTAKSDNLTQTRSLNLVVTKPLETDPKLLLSNIDHAWRVDWALPSGGRQITLVW